MQARELLERKQGKGFKATGGSRTPMQGSSAKIEREPTAESSGGREGGVKWGGGERLGLPFGVRPRRWVCSWLRGAGWVGAEVPHVQRKRHSHQRLRDSGCGESPALKRGISFQ